MTVSDIADTVNNCGGCMKNWLKVLLAVLFIGAVAACAENSGPGLGQKFTLRVGQSASIDGEGLTLRFDAVLSDSRCPSDVQCIRAGEAEVRLITTQGGEATPLTLVEQGLTSGLNVVDYKNYTIEFKLTPYPVSTRALGASDYRLELKVTKD
jgi:hypothetical protein